MQAYKRCELLLLFSPIFARNLLTSQSHTQPGRRRSHPFRESSLYLFGAIRANAGIVSNRVFNMSVSPCHMVPTSHAF